MTVSEQGRRAIKLAEGLPPDGRPALKAYRCSAGVWTVGWGSTRGVKRDMVVTEDEAEARLTVDLAEYETVVSDNVRVPLTPHQFDALVMFAMNVGASGFRRSTLLSLLNNGRYDLAAEQFKVWNKARDPQTGKLVENRGLKNRRDWERKIFLEADYAKAY